MAARRLPTPVVLALASGMICVGVVAVIATGDDGEAEAEAPRSPHEIPVDARTPESSAETFLDAWRKRDHEICKQLSVEGAREAVVLREEEDQAQLSARERGREKEEKEKKRGRNIICVRAVPAQATTTSA